MLPCNAVIGLEGTFFHGVGKVEGEQKKLCSFKTLREFVSIH